MVSFRTRASSEAEDVLSTVWKGRAEVAGVGIGLEVAQTQRLLMRAGMLGLLCSTLSVAGYDFYGRTRYPDGGGRLPGVDLHRPTQTGTAEPTAYERRTVKWWPRKGVDIIEVQEGMPLRTWTWREKQPGLPPSFKAHLIAFRGIGNTMSSKFRGGDGAPIEPAVVLRLADGRKRCFLRGSFSAADKKFIMDLYVREMNRITAGLDKTPRAKRPSSDIKFPNNAKPGEPGTMQVESDHFVFVSGSQAGEVGDPWVNEKEPEKSAWFRKGSVKCAEYWWAMNEYAGHLMPYWDRKEQLKYEITVVGTKRDGHLVMPGYAGGGYGACGIKHAIGGPWSMGLFHEWGHGALGNRWRGGGGEAQADAHQTFASPVLKGNHHIKAPWRNIFNGGMGYTYTVFYNLVADDPNWGYGWYVAAPSGAGEQSIMQIAARLGQQRGMFKNGIRGFGDMMGEYGARLATFDCELEDLYRTAYLAPARSWLEPVDRARGIYRIPMAEAPEPYGVNIVRLVADGGGEAIVVDFTGLHDPDFFSDWRACIVALGADGRTRYSPMWSKGTMEMERREGDIGYWLTVAATPTALYSGDLIRSIYSGRYAYRYPWSVRLAGARPGTPRECSADFHDVSLRYKLEDAVPAPHDTPAGKAYIAAIETFIAQQRDSDEANKLKSKLQAEIAHMTEGRRHPNGGGWVAKSATVAETAFVGPDAMVLGGAKVLDHAIIEDYAIVTDRAVVSGHARISGAAVVKGSAQAKGHARTWGILSDEATVVPKRPGATALSKDGLWANYAMDRDEKTVLVDWYRFAHGADKRYAMRLWPNLNGYLSGRPRFAIDGDRRGFTFDGKTQYGELSPRVADLGEMTVDLALKWADKGSQTILDLGASTDHCLVLRTDDAGKPEVVATVTGEVVARASAGKALPTGTWVRLRIESDGEVLSLWVDGEKVGSQATGFRPCDAFPAGATKRNFVAATRNDSGHFRGTIDYIVFYHTVHDDFSQIPPPIRDAPTRPTREFIAAMEEDLGNVAIVNEKIRAGVNERHAHYDKLQKQMEARARELLERSPAFLKSEATLAAVKEANEERKRRLTAEFSRTPEGAKSQAELDALKTRLSALSDATRKLESERFDGDEELRALTARRKEAETQYRAREKELRQAYEETPEGQAGRTGIAELDKRLRELRSEVHKLEATAREQDAELKALYEKRKASPNDHAVHRRIGEREKAARDKVRKTSPVARERDELEDKRRSLDRAFRTALSALCAEDKVYARSMAERKQCDSAIRDRQNGLREELRKSADPAREHARLSKKVRELDRSQRGRRERFIGKHTGEMLKKVGQAEAELARARDVAMAPYGPEKLWIDSFRYQAYRGHYNTTYKGYLGGYVKGLVAGGEMRENLDLLNSLQKSAAGGEGWHTSVDWEWRMKEELDGRIAELPLMQKWLLRVRGKAK